MHQERTQRVDFNILEHHLRWTTEVAATDPMSGKGLGGTDLKKARDEKGCKRGHHVVKDPEREVDVTHMRETGQADQGSGLVTGLVTPTSEAAIPERGNILSEFVAKGPKKGLSHFARAQNFVRSNKRTIQGILTKFVVFKFYLTL